jgi:hypothetical protein
MKRPSCEKQPQKTTFSSRHPALMLVNLTVVSLEPKMGWTTREDNPAVLMIYQDDCVRTIKRNNELALMSPSTDPASFRFFIEAERVDLAKPIGLVNPLPPLPREEVVVSLATWDDAESEPFAVSRSGAKDGGCFARGIPLGSSTMGA